MSGKKKAVAYVVANPRGLREGSWIVRQGERRWFEGDVFDGEVTERLVEQGFVVEAAGG